MLSILREKQIQVDEKMITTDQNSKEKEFSLQKELLTSDRKLEHIKICLNEDVDSRLTAYSHFDDISFVHKALPELSLEEISLRTTLLGKAMQAPIIASAITGGHEVAATINTVIAEAIGQLGLGMGVGSQRAALENPDVAYTFAVVREKAPEALIIGNIGAPQLVDEYGIEKLEDAIEMIQADALAIHLNALQEAIQWEGDTNFKGVCGKIKDIAQQLSKPVVIKEVGSGISHETAKHFVDSNVAAIEICGTGGTSWAAVEAYRAKAVNDTVLYNIGQNFRHWGIPTPISTVEVSSVFPKQVIASGGIRNGIDIAKAIALGADAAGVALPVLKHVDSGQLMSYFQQLIRELQITMFLVGAKSIAELRQAPLIITGKTADWLNQRGISMKYRKNRV